MQIYDYSCRKCLTHWQKQTNAHSNVIKLWKEKTLTFHTILVLEDIPIEKMLASFTKKPIFHYTWFPMYLFNNKKILISTALTRCASTMLFLNFFQISIKEDVPPCKQLSISRNKKDNTDPQTHGSLHRRRPRIQDSSGKRIPKCNKPWSWQTHGSARANSLIRRRIWRN